MYLRLPFHCCCTATFCWIGFYWQKQLGRGSHYLELNHTHSTYHLICSKQASRPTPDASISRKKDSKYHKISCMHLMQLIFFALSYKPWYILFHDHSAFINVSFLSGLHTTAVTGENLLWQFGVSRNDHNSFFSFAFRWWPCPVALVPSHQFMI